MKIIKSGKTKKPKVNVTSCNCGCRFSFEKREAQFVSYPRDGNCYVVKCPECKTEIWVYSSLVN